jgi:hypothetical protein
MNKTSAAAGRLYEKGGCSKLKKEALDRCLWRNRFERDRGLIAEQIRF